MSVEMAIWRMDDEGPKQVEWSQMDSERDLEDMLAKDPSMTGTGLLIIGRQVHTDFGGFVDLLALDGEGCVHVLELKRDQTSRDVVAQTLDYGGWSKDLDLERLEQIYRDYLTSLGNEAGEMSLDDAFAEYFDSPLPDVVNNEQQFTVVASQLDPASDRIIQFLAETYAVPINAVFFRHFKDGDHKYLARTWLIDPQQVENIKPRHRKHRPWNGRDFYMVLGRAGEEHRWNIALKYDFLNAGGGRVYSITLRNYLKEGSRVFAFVGRAGYVGIGEVTGPAKPAREVTIEKNGESRLLVDQPDLADFKYNALLEDPDLTEWVVPVEWRSETREISQAYWERGLFSSPTTVCRLRDTRTIEAVEREFGVQDN